MAYVGIVGKKCGMTRCFDEDGRSTPVSFIKVDFNRVSRLIDKDKNGYCAIQVAWGVCKGTSISKSERGFYAKAGIEPADGLLEYRLSEQELEKYNIDDEISVDLFEVGQKVDVSGITKGKGFSGVIKRHNFRGQRNTHGNSLSHRAHGSIGQCQTPGRVFKGKKMAGHLGHVRRTVQNLEIIRIDPEEKVLLIKGAVPAVKGAHVFIRPAIKGKLS